MDGNFGVHAGEPVSLLAAREEWAKLKKELDRLKQKRSKLGRGTEEWRFAGKAIEARERRLNYLKEWVEENDPDEIARKQRREEIVAARDILRTRLAKHGQDLEFLQGLHTLLKDLTGKFDKQDINPAEQALIDILHDIAYPK